MKSDKEIIKQIDEIEQLTRQLRIDLVERSCQEKKTGKFKVGDRVIIANPKEGQEREGVVTKIGTSRATIQTKQEKKIVRTFKNLKKG